MENIKINEIKEKLKEYDKIFNYNQSKEPFRSARDSDFEPDLLSTEKLGITLRTFQLITHNIEDILDDQYFNFLKKLKSELVSFQNWRRDYKTPSQSDLVKKPRRLEQYNNCRIFYKKFGFNNQLKKLDKDISPLESEIREERGNLQRQVDRLGSVTRDLLDKIEALAKNYQQKKSLPSIESDMNRISVDYSKFDFSAYPQTEKFHQSVLSKLKLVKEKLENSPKEPLNYLSKFYADVSRIMSSFYVNSKLELSPRKFSIYHLAQQSADRRVDISDLREWGIEAYKDFQGVFDMFMKPLGEHQTVVFSLQKEDHQYVLHGYESSKSGRVKNREDRFFKMTLQEILKNYNGKLQMYPSKEDGNFVHYMVIFPERTFCHNNFLEKLKK